MKVLFLGLGALFLARLWPWRRPDLRSTNGGEPASISELSKAPEKARARQNRWQRTKLRLPRQNLFERHCAECHVRRRGGKKGPSLV